MRRPRPLLEEKRHGADLSVVSLMTQSGRFQKIDGSMALSPPEKDIAWGNLFQEFLEGQKPPGRIRTAISGDHDHRQRNTGRKEDQRDSARAPVVVRTMAIATKVQSPGKQNAQPFKLCLREPRG